MGCCISTSSSPSVMTAKVITSNGQLREYPLPATVCLVLEREAASSPSLFMCSSEGLDYDKFIPVLELDDHLLSNQIYFILPKSKLQRRISAPEMAAMAVMASSALASNNTRRHRSRISPLLPVVLDDAFKPENAMLEKSGSVRRMQKSASRRAKMAVRSFRLRLTTIHEGLTLGKDDYSRFDD